MRRSAQTAELCLPPLNPEEIPEPVHGSVGSDYSVISFRKKLHRLSRYIGLLTGIGEVSVLMPGQGTLNSFLTYFQYYKPLPIQEDRKKTKKRRRKGAF